MHVLILSCSTGGGHNAAGAAMKEALEAAGHQAVLAALYGSGREKSGGHGGQYLPKDGKTFPKNVRSAL